MANINSLPYLALRTIFSNLPLADLLEIHQVCSLWAWYQNETLSKVTHLTLLIGTNPLERIRTKSFNRNFVQFSRIDHLKDNSQICCKFLNKSIVHFLKDKLPLISNLTIVIHSNDITVNEQIISLLKIWSGSLTTLKLYIWFGNNPDVPQITVKCRKLIKAINSLANLVHLTFDVNQRIFRQTSLPEFPILTRLKQFYFSSKNTISMTPIMLSLKQYGTHLEQIGIGNDGLVLELAQFAREFPQLAAKFTQLPRVIWTSGIQFNGMNSLKETFSFFNSLTHVNLSQFPVDLIQLLDTLSPLKSLKTLEVTFDRFQLPMSQIDNIDQAKLLQFASVKTLILWAKVQNHTDLNCQHWSYIFPSIQVLQLHHTCQLCGICPNFCMEVTREIHNRMLTEMTNILNTFAKCPKLKSIFTDKPFNALWSQNWVVKEVAGKKVVRNV